MPQTILITGASRGIGLALCKELIGKGHRVVAGMRNPDGWQGLAKVDYPCQTVQLDITSQDSVQSAAKAVGEMVSGIDVLVNNAAIFPEEGNESIRDIDLAHFGAAFETNVVGTLRVTRAFLPLLEKGTNPRIVNISSGAGSISGKDDHGYYAYSTSKAALNMATRALAAELKPQKICVVAMSPGWVKTDMGGPNAPLTPEESARSIAKTIDHLSMRQTAMFLDRDGEPYADGW
ncbi:MAG: SDR family oxidoreductase [Chthoniobacteraceae bacterium]